MTEQSVKYLPKVLQNYYNSITDFKKKMLNKIRRVYETI